jgi:hypothetical protein
MRHWYHALKTAALLILLFVLLTLGVNYKQAMDIGYDYGYDDGYDAASATCLQAPIPSSEAQ